MDTQTLEAELRQAQAQARQARSAINTAEPSSLSVRASWPSRKRNAPLRRAGRGGFVSPQKLDSDRTRMLTAKSALVASRSQVIEAESALEAATAATERVRSDIEDSTLKAARAGRVQYRLAEPGEVLPAGGKVVTMLDVSDVYMTVFLPETLAGASRSVRRRASCSTRRLSTSFPPRFPTLRPRRSSRPRRWRRRASGRSSHSASRCRSIRNSLRKYRAQVKTGLPGVAYVRFDSHADWPPALQPRLPQ